jgi:Tfp pilus assembly protein PilF
MAKPMLVTLPVVLLLLDQWPLRRGLRLKEKLPFFAAALASSIVTYLSHQTGGAVATFEVVPLAMRIENAFVTYVVYIQQSFWPARLAVFYPYPLHSLLVSAIFAGVALLTVTVLVALAYLNRPYLAVGWLWYLVTLLPVIGIIQTGSQARADRYTYIPMIGLSIAVVWALAELLAPRPKLAAALAAAVTAACLALTWIQVQYWHDSIALYQHAIAVVPDNYLAHFNQASALDAEGKTDEAIAQLREAVRVRPLYVPARAELGQLLARQGHPDEALSELRTAVSQRSNDPVAHFRLGSVLGSLGHADEASAEFAEAVRLQPGNADAHFNYGIALAQQGRLQDALREFTCTVGLRPDDAAAHFNLGITFAQLGQLDPAIAHFSEAVRLKPDFAEARQALDRALDLQQRPTSR